MAEGLLEGFPGSRFGYADDITIVRFGGDTQLAARAAEQEVAHLSQWVKENAIHFDPDKTEVLNVSKSKVQGPPIACVDLGEKLTSPSSSIRWLGVHLDSTLSFRKHVEVWCGKARNLTCLLCRINPIMRGAAPGAVVRLVEACVISVATYRADIW